MKTTQKMRRLISLLMALCLMFTLVACGSTASSETAAVSEETVETVESSVEETTAAAPEEPAADPEPAEESVAQEEVAEPAAVVDSSALYPVFEEVTEITAFLNIAPWASAYIGPEAEFENAKAILVAEEKTNVHLEVTWSDPDTYNEKLNLMLASSDFSDIIRNAANLFSTGIDGLIDEEICVDLMPYFEEYAPEYYALLESNPTFKQDVTSTTGAAVTMFSYTESPNYTRGPVVRKDMLDAVGAEIPTTVDELYEVAVALKNNGVPYPVVGPQFLSGAYNASGITSSMGTVEMNWWNIDGTITPAITLDSMYDYIETCRQWAAEGLFIEDWYNAKPMYDSYMLADELAMCFGPYSITSDATRATAANPDTTVIYPMANVTLNEGDTIKSLDGSIGGVGDGDWCITTAHPEYLTQIISYINWFFTEEGIFVSNFGLEGEACEVDADGNVNYSELILEDPNGYGSMAVYAIFTNNNDNPFYYKMERTSLTYDNEVEATVYDTWLSNISGEYVFSVKLTPEETEAYNAVATDVTTYIAENASKFVMGDLPLEDWDSFIDTLYELGLDEMTAVYQSAYDRG